MAQTPDSMGTARWILPGSVEMNSIRSLSKSPHESLLCFIIAIDEYNYPRLFISIREKEMNFGKSWDYPALKPEETIISSSLADANNVRIGDLLTIKVNLSRYIQEETVRP